MNGVTETEDGVLAAFVIYYSYVSKRLHQRDMNFTTNFPRIDSEEIASVRRGILESLTVHP